MKTITIAADDLFELKLLRDKLDREADVEFRANDPKFRHASGGGRFTDKERDLRKSVEVFDRILK